MAFNFICSCITLILLSSTGSIHAPEIKSARLLDLLIRDYTFRSYHKNFRTGKLHKINLPANLSGLDVYTIRFRCGSLRRYGARINEFHLRAGVYAHPCTTRVMIVHQNLGSKWLSLYYNNYELTGYELISPVLGLLAYNLGITNLSEVAICTEKSPITVDFTNTSMLQSQTSGIIPLCASFDQHGKVRMWDQAKPGVCTASGLGHFGLVVESPLLPLKQKVGKWKLGIVSSIGAALGAFLLGLLAIAMFVKAKKKARLEEMERMAYEEEALQVSMVGHVRALVASGTRTGPDNAENHEGRLPPSRTHHGSNSWTLQTIFLGSLVLFVGSCKFKLVPIR